MRVCSGSDAGHVASLHACNKIPVLYSLSQWEGNFLAGAVTDDAVSMKIHRQRPAQHAARSRTASRTPRGSAIDASEGSMRARKAATIKGQELLYGLEEPSWSVPSVPSHLQP